MIGPAKVIKIIESYRDGLTSRQEAADWISKVHHQSNTADKAKIYDILRNTLLGHPIRGRIVNGQPISTPALAVVAIAATAATEELPAFIFSRLESSDAMQAASWASELALTLQSCLVQYHARFSDSTIGRIGELCNTEESFAANLPASVAQSLAAIKATIGRMKLERLLAQSDFDQRGNPTETAQRPENEGGWQRISLLGSGGQSEVYLARSAKRVIERKNSLRDVVHLWASPSHDDAAHLADCLWNYARPEVPSELGALKIFKVRSDKPGAQAEAIERLKREVHVLKRNFPGLLKLLDSNADEGWIVTEYFPKRSLLHHLPRYRGKARDALRAFRSIVAAVTNLHAENIVHRDIKPANIFVGNDGDLVLGDFGIVFLPSAEDRPTLEDERVGSRDYIPDWADLGERLEDVRPNFDVYMLGKLLWCMVAGKLKLPRESQHEQRHDVSVMFKADPAMFLINHLLDKCVVVEPEKCLPSAAELLELVDETLMVIDRGGQALGQGVPIVCRVCGRGNYHPAPAMAGVTSQHAIIQLYKTVNQSAEHSGRSLFLRPLICDACGNVQFFT